MSVVVIGSLNIDHVYTVDQFVRPGQTITTSSYEIYAGGKGFNQSIALARAGSGVVHIGKIGPDGEWLKARLYDEHVDTSHLETDMIPTGHAMIQVVTSGENAIFLYPGANHTLDIDRVEDALAAHTPSSPDLETGHCGFLLLQNETNIVADLIRLGHKYNRFIVLNPAPMTNDVIDYPLELVGLFILNRNEAVRLFGQTEPDAVRAAVRAKYPSARVIYTLGAEGAHYFDSEVSYFQPCYKVEAVDSTGAGDTFIGYFIAAISAGSSVETALNTAAKAAALCVTRHGASDSIPFVDEVRSAHFE